MEAPKKTKNVGIRKEDTQNTSVYGPDGKRKPPAAFLEHVGKGRPKGVPNKTTASIRNMLEEALGKAGGAEYFYNLMINGTASDRQAMLALLGRCMPMQIQQQLSGSVKFELPWLASRGIGKVQESDTESLALVGKSRAQQDIQDAEIIEHDTGRLQGDSTAGAGSHD